MLNYFDKKKTLDICEDSLTSTVFDLLKYLPTEVFYSILRESLYHKKLPIICGEIEKIHFWEKWISKNTTNSLYVEPDVFIRFSNFDIIIEAKRYNNNQQSEKQGDNSNKLLPLTLTLWILLDYVVHQQQEFTKMFTYDIYN